MYLNVKSNLKKAVITLIAVVMIVTAVSVSGIGITASAVTGNEVVAYARQFIGYPYVYGTHGPNSFDCSGFVHYVFKHFGMNMPVVANDYWTNSSAYGTVIAYGSVENAQAGDIISWSNPNHVAIYTENGMCVEALNSKYGVCEKIRVNGHTNGMNYKVIRPKYSGSVPRYALDVNVDVNNQIFYNGHDNVTFDVYINGSCVAAGVKDFCREYEKGASYTINAIKTTGNYVVSGSTSYSGKLDSAKTVALKISNPELKKSVTYKNNKYEYYSGVTSWSNAKSIAESKGGRLATITSAAEQSFIVKNNAIGVCWLGGTDAEKEGTWKWVTGEKWNYTNWQSGEPNNYNNKEHYLGLYTSNQWNDFGDYDENVKGFIVEYENIIPVLKKTITYNGNKYEYYLCSSSWTNAKSFAESKGGHLATITSSGEQGILAENNVIGHCWLGGSDAEKEGAWKWVTGEKWNYTNWTTGEPNNGNGSDEDYLGFYASNKWNDYGNLASSIKGFIVEYDNVVPVLKKTLRFNGNVYEYYSCKTSWSDADSIAKSKGGHLATITSAEEQNVVATNNVVGHCWLGATDAEKEGAWKWVTGEKWNYTNWTTGEPNDGNGGEDYLGLYESNKWNDFGNYSGTIMGFIVEYDHTHKSVPFGYVAPTCTQSGYSAGECCELCGEIFKEPETIPPTGHKPVVTAKAKAATCTKPGLTEEVECSVCGGLLEVQVKVRATGHKYVTAVEKATLAKDGARITKCAHCNAVKAKTAIAKVESVKLTKTSFRYNGEVQLPNVIVKDSDGKTLRNYTDYIVRYTGGCKNVGRYNVRVIFMGNYSGSKAFTFNIVPKSTVVAKLTAGNNQFTALLGRQVSQVTGYELQYGLKSDMSDAETLSTSNNKTTSLTVKNLTSGKKYYVRVRTYKTVTISGQKVKIYSSWSAVKNVQVK